MLVYKYMRLFGAQLKTAFYAIIVGILILITFVIGVVALTLGNIPASLLMDIVAIGICLFLIRDLKIFFKEIDMFADELKELDVDYKGIFERKE